jgi:hypothetical protein
MYTTNPTTVVGVFQDHTQAERAVRELKHVGLPRSQITVLARNAGGAAQAMALRKEGSKAAVGAVAGALLGAGIGALYAIAIAGIGLPGLGPVLFGKSLLVSLLCSAGVGAVAAGIAGALIGLGIPREEARFDDDEVHGDRVLVTMRTDGRDDEADAIFRRFGAYDIYTRGTGRPMLTAVR